MVNPKRQHNPKAIILQAVRWYTAYSLSYRDIEKLMQERGVDAGHTKLQRWAVECSPKLEKTFRQHKHLTIP